MGEESLLTHQFMTMLGDGQSVIDSCSFFGVLSCVCDVSEGGIKYLVGCAFYNISFSNLIGCSL